MRAAPGRNSRKSPSCFAASSCEMKLTPVTLPPGRLRLATRPALTGSKAPTNTMGIVVVAVLAANAAGGANHHRPCVSFFRCHPVHALECELEIVAMVAIEDWYCVSARILGQTFAACCGREQHRSQRINDTLSGSRKARARSSGHGCRAGRSRPTPCGSSFMRSPTILATFSARLQHRSRSRTGR
jgi:hypothetical protein